jgi:hypothetical protein
MTGDDEFTDDTPAPAPFRMVGGAGGPVCAGDVCELPASVDVEQLNP